MRLLGSILGLLLLIGLLGLVLRLGSVELLVLVLVLRLSVCQRYLRVLGINGSELLLRDVLWLSVECH